MKLSIDARPSTNNDQDPTFIIRIFPENNEDIGKMEWGLAIDYHPTEMIRVVNGEFHYAVIFKRSQ